MATIYWTGNAHSVRQISTVTVANTWAANDTVTLTINGKDLVVTIGATGTSTSSVATAIKEAWNGSQRLNADGSTDSTSNFGGQEFGEFREATATVSGSVVTLTANAAGKPFTLTVTESTAGTGTATGATTQTATGKNHWDNGDNWSGGSVPANDDVVVFKDSDVSCLYGLPNASLEVTIQVWMSYTGEVGLPTINVDDPSYSYYEYRQRYVRLDDAGTGTNIAHRFGLGKDGAGCRLFNLKHSTVKCSPVVYNTGTPLLSRVGAKALNICCTANTSTINILGGSVDFSSQDSGTSAFVTVTQTGGDARGVTGIYSTGAVVTLANGTLLVGGTGTLNSVRVPGGTLTLENQTGTITALSVTGGDVNYASTATISQLLLQGGSFDARHDIGGFTLTNSIIYAGSRYYDPYRRATYTNPLQLAFDTTADLQFGGTVDNTVNISVN